MLLIKSQISSEDEQWVCRLSHDSKVAVHQQPAEWRPLIGVCLPPYHYRKARATALSMAELTGVFSDCGVWLSDPCRLNTRTCFQESYFFERPQSILGINLQGNNGEMSGACAHRRRKIKARSSERNTENSQLKDKPDRRKRTSFSAVTLL